MRRNRICAIFGLRDIAANQFSPINSQLFFSKIGTVVLQARYLVGSEASSTFRRAFGLPMIPRRVICSKRSARRSDRQRIVSQNLQEIEREIDNVEPDKENENYDIKRKSSRTSNSHRKTTQANEMDEEVERLESTQNGKQTETKAHNQIKRKSGPDYLLCLPVRINSTLILFHL
jgi:hypothetical protein